MLGEIRSHSTGGSSSPNSARTSTCRSIQNLLTFAQWNVTYQRQFAGSWVASVSYLGNKTTHLWIAEERDPALFMGLGACTIAGVSYNPCSTTANAQQRRLLFQASPANGIYYASVDTMDD